MHSPKIGTSERGMLSPVFIDRSVPQASPSTAGCGTSNCNTSLASTSMVPFTSGTLHRLPSSASTGPLPFNEGSGSTPTRPSPLSWVACFHRSFETAQISPEVREILLSAWRPNTTKSYASAWNKWNSWCVEHHCDPISPPLPAVLNFLCCQFQAGYAYRSLIVYTSALSAILPQVDAQKVGSHPLVSQFLMGVFQLRPPPPRYTETWDVAKVTCFLKSLWSNSLLTTKMLTQKLAMLLSLTVPGRCSELAVRDLRFRRFYPEGVVFNLAALTKTVGTGEVLKSCFHSRFNEDLNLYPYSMCLS